jgi:hypothetical protein
MKKLVLILTVAFVGVAAWSQSPSSDVDLTKKQLAKVTGFCVVVSVQPDSLASLLPVSSIQTDVELKMRIAHMPILTADQYVTDTGSGAGLVTITVGGVRSSTSPIWAISLNAACTQSAQLLRDPRVGTLGLTWFDSIVIITGETNVAQFREYIKDSVDKFINLYLSANP